MEKTSQIIAQPRQNKPRTVKTSLTRQTLIKIALIVIGVTIVTSALSYFYLFTSLQSQFSEQLDKYIRERVARENFTFKLVQDNQSLLKDQVLQKVQDATGK